MTFGSPAQTPATDRASGTGPFETLILRDVMIVDGTGAAPYGPADIVVNGDRITGIWEPNGASGLTERPPTDGAEVMDLNGAYVMPGLIDSHAHIGKPEQAPSADYVYELWLGHGVTTVRELGAFNGLDWTLNEARRAAANEIAAPRLHIYPALRAGTLTGPVHNQIATFIAIGD